MNSGGIDWSKLTEREHRIAMVAEGAGHAQGICEAAVVARAFLHARGDAKAGQALHDRIWKLRFERLEKAAK